MNKRQLSNMSVCRCASAQLWHRAKKSALARRRRDCVMSFAAVLGAHGPCEMLRR